MKLLGFHDACPHKYKSCEHRHYSVAGAAVAPLSVYPIAKNGSAIPRGVKPTTGTPEPTGTGRVRVYPSALLQTRSLALITHQNHSQLCSNFFTLQKPTLCSTALISSNNPGHKITDIYLFYSGLIARNIFESLKNIP